MYAALQAALDALQVSAQGFRVSWSARRQGAAARLCWIAADRAPAVSPPGIPFSTARDCLVAHGPAAALEGLQINHCRRELVLVASG